MQNYKNHKVVFHDKERCRINETMKAYLGFTLLRDVLLYHIFIISSLINTMFKRRMLFKIDQ